MIFFGFKKKIPESHEGKISFATVSDTGLVRGENQDLVYADPDRLVFSVADGVGGGEDGAVASAMVCANLKMMLYAAGEDFASRKAAVQQAIEEANAEIFERSRRKGLSAMGSTVAVLVMDPADRRRVAVCNVGDSRVYLIRGGMPELLTRDHRLDGSHTLTRAVGIGCKVQTRWFESVCDYGSRFLVCTDGVHDQLTDARIAVFSSAGPVEAAARRLSDDVLKHGAPDNYSFVLVSI